MHTYTYTNAFMMCTVLKQLHESLLVTTKYDIEW